MKKTIPLPIMITKEGKWFIAFCPLLDLATQGETEKEVKENMEDLVKEYFKDPDTPKPKLQILQSTSIQLSNIPVQLPEGETHSKSKALAKA